MVPIATGDGLKLASFDGGGIPSFSQLKVMQLLMHQVGFKAPPNDKKIVLPCEYFDLIGGSDTGGLIAIMFVKLRMSVEEAMAEFAVIVDEVYTDDLLPEDRTSRLRRCMESLLSKRELPLDLKLEDKRHGGPCVGFVSAAHKLNVRMKVCLRTYFMERELPSEITVIDAALATCASQPGFLPLSFGASYDGHEYVGAVLGANNPVRQVISEAHTYFGDRQTTLLLSFGSGYPGILSLSAAKTDNGLYRLMRKMLEDSEREAEAVQQEMVDEKYYFRFSVEHGMERDHEAHIAEPCWIVAQALGYLANPETKRRTHECAEKIRSSLGLSQNNQSGTVIGPHPDRKADKSTDIEKRNPGSNVKQILEGTVDQLPDIATLGFQDLEDIQHSLETLGHQEATDGQSCGHSNDGSLRVEFPSVEKALPEPPAYETREIAGQVITSSSSGHRNVESRSIVPFNTDYKHGGKGRAERVDRTVQRLRGQPEHRIFDALKSNACLQGAIL